MTTTKTTNTIRLTGGVAALLFSLGVFAQTTIVGSKHDLSSAASGGQVCIFCHTPHGAADTAATPLWNKNLPAASGFTMYSTLNSATMDAVQGNLGSVSLACMSCHDGVGSVDAVLNLPGSGLNPGNIGGGVDVPLTGDAVLGADLSNDHPVSMQYGGGGCGVVNTTTTAPNCTTTNDPAFVLPAGGVAGAAGPAPRPIWYIDVDGDNIREASDIILYNREDLVANFIEPSVECGSCHDPHNGTQPANQVMFLRVDNTNSAVCTACHVK